MKLYNDVEEIYKVVPHLLKYKIIMDLLEKSKDEFGISRISIATMSRISGYSPTTLSLASRKLMEYDGCIKKVKRGSYIVINSDMMTYGPVSKVFRLYKVWMNELTFFSKYEYNLRVEKSGLTMKEYQFAEPHIFSVINIISREEQVVDQIKALCDKFERYNQIGQYAE